MSHSGHIMNSRRRFLSHSLPTIAAGLLLPGFTPLLLRRTSHEDERPHIERAFFTMGTVMTISAYGNTRAQVNRAITRVFREFQRLDMMLSVFKTSSQISLVNATAGKSDISVDRETMTLLKLARHYNVLTAGTFDVTVEPLMNLWGFRREPLSIQSPPTDREIAQTLDAVGMTHVVVDEKESRVGLTNEHTQLDFGGIAVGFSVDRAVRILKEEGIETAFINHSGDAFALGSPPGLGGWEVAIPNPLQPDKILRTLTLRDRAISTSGAYEKYIPIEGRNYGHIMNPTSGRPSDAVLSTSVIARSAVEADALSTATFCMTPGESEKLLSLNPGVDLIVATRSTDGIETRKMSNPAADPIPSRTG